MHTGLPAINNWTLTRKFLFLFFAAYFFIYIFPFPIGFIPFADTLNIWYIGIWDALVPWAGKNMLHVSYPITIKANGSGDRTYNYVQLLLFVIFAIAAVIILILTVKKRKFNDLLAYWLLVYVRYFLAFTMMCYGIFKIIKTQFPFPFYNLTETYGDSSPMGLLWNFMGYSTAFNIFTGIAEATGGILLWFRKTTTFGALVCIAVLSNIVAMNFSYDVPAKLFSSNLLLMAIFIVAPDVPRLINFFFRNKAVPAVRTLANFNSRWMKITQNIVKAIFICTVLYSTINMVLKRYTSFGDKAIQRIPLFGIYKVIKFVKNKEILIPLTSDSLQWKQLKIVYANHATVKMMNDSSKSLSFIPDTTKKTVNLVEYSDGLHKSTFKYYHLDSTHLVFIGKLNNDSVYINMEKVDLDKLRLINRGFHWINEFPNSH